MRTRQASSQCLNRWVVFLLWQGIQLINGTMGTVGSNMLSENVTVLASETKGYTTTVGTGGVQKPSVRFTYRYNNANYTVEASMPESML